MNTLTHISTPRTFRRLSAKAIAHFAATHAQAARLAGLGPYPARRAIPAARIWDSSLLDRLSTPLSRVHE